MFFAGLLGVRFSISVHKEKMRKKSGVLLDFAYFACLVADLITAAMGMIALDTPTVRSSMVAPATVIPGVSLLFDAVWL